MLCIDDTYCLKQSANRYSLLSTYHTGIRIVFLQIIANKKICLNNESTRRSTTREPKSRERTKVKFSCIIFRANKRLDGTTCLTIHTRSLIILFSARLILKELLFLCAETNFGVLFAIIFIYLGSRLLSPSS